FTDAADDGVDCRADFAAAAERRERAHHAGDGAEQTEQRSRGDDGVESRHALLEPAELLARGTDEGVGHRKFLVRKAVDQNASDEVIALAADGESALDVATLDALEHLHDDLWFTARILAEREEHALD